MTPDNLLDTLFAQSPYVDFPLDKYPAREGGWHSDNVVIDRLVDEMKPGLIIEVGTWLGGSALHMGKSLKEQGQCGKVLCVDTWLGAAEFWDSQQDTERYQALAIKHGFPSVFYQFVANVLHVGLKDVIIPFPQTSTNAATWLKRRKVQAPLIYIDGSHEEADVMADLTHYWELLELGGVIFGDDYDAFWPGVIIAVNRFATERGLMLVQEGGFWMLRKSAAEPGVAPQVREDELAALRAENAILRAQQTASLARTEEMVSLLVHLKDAQKNTDHFIDLVKQETARAGFFYDKFIFANDALKKAGLPPIPND